MARKRTEEAAGVSMELVRPLLEEIDVAVGHSRIVDALKAHSKTHDTLMRVRLIPLQYSPTYVEPLTALRWIENGGHGVE